LELLRPRRALAAEERGDRPDAGKTLVLFQSSDAWEEVEPADAADGAVEVADLVIEGVDRVRFGRRAYPVQREGLYRFMTLRRSVQNLISLRDRRSPLPLLGALAALQVHGNRHDVDSLDRLKSRLRVEPWVCITCGTIAALAASVLRDRGYNTRRVTAQTLEKPNGYDDGHELFEVQWPGENRWVLVDVDMGLLFKDGGAFLSATDFAERVKQNRPPEFVALAQKAAVLDPFFPGPDGYNYALEFRWRWGTPQGKWRWYRRVMQRVNVEA
jgi:hypothetical protein